MCISIEFASKILCKRNKVFPVICTCNWLWCLCPIFCKCLKWLEFLSGLCTEFALASLKCISETSCMVQTTIKIHFCENILTNVQIMFYLNSYFSFFLNKREYVLSFCHLNYSCIFLMYRNLYLHSLVHKNSLKF